MSTDLDRFEEVSYDDKMEPHVVFRGKKKPKEERKSPDTKEAKKIDVASDGKVSVIVLCWNNLNYTKTCIDSLKACTDRALLQIIAVDQGSTDGTMEYLVKALDGAKDIAIRNALNRGFSGGNNQALQLAQHEFVFFLNNDCKVLKHDWLRILIDAEKKADLIGRDCMKVIPDYEKEAFKFIGRAKTTDDWSYIEGWCLFAKRELFLEIGGFDMRFNPAYSDDSDLSFRMKAMGGTLGTVNLPIKHFGSKSVEMIKRSFGKQSEKSNRLLYEKWIAKEDDNKDQDPEKSMEEGKYQMSILVKRRGARGDVLMTTPILRALKIKYPLAFITVETECPDVLSRNPNVNHLDKHIPKPDDYDMVLSPWYEHVPEDNAIDVMARQCNVELEDKKMEIVLNEGHMNFARNIIDPRKRHIAVHTGRCWKEREWAINRFAEVFKYYRARDFQVVELGDRNTLYTGKGIDVRGCAVKQSAAIISLCDLFLGIDSLCSNLAKAVSTPAAIIYGCVDPSCRKADAVEMPIWIEDLECKGCRNRTSEEWVQCNQEDIFCLTKLSVEMVTDAVDSFLYELEDD